MKKLIMMMAACAMIMAACGNDDEEEVSVVGDKPFFHATINSDVIMEKDGGENRERLNMLSTTTCKKDGKKYAYVDMWYDLTTPANDSLTFFFHLCNPDVGLFSIDNYNDYRFNQDWMFSKNGGYVNIVKSDSTEVRYIPKAHSPLTIHIMRMHKTEKESGEHYDAKYQLAGAITGKLFNQHDDRDSIYLHAKFVMK